MAYTVPIGALITLGHQDDFDARLAFATNNQGANPNVWRPPVGVLKYGSGENTRLACFYDDREMQNSIRLLQDAGVHVTVFRPRPQLLTGGFYV